jgi:hypothetical protein
VHLAVVLLLVHRRGNLGPQSAPSKSSTRALPVPITVTLLGAEFLVEGVVVVFLSVLLEFLRAISFDASVVVVGSQGYLVVLIALVSGGFSSVGS